MKSNILSAVDYKKLCCLSTEIHFGRPYDKDQFIDIVARAIDHQDRVPLALERAYEMLAKTDRVKYVCFAIFSVNVSRPMFSVNDYCLLTDIAQQVYHGDPYDEVALRTIISAVIGNAPIDKTLAKVTDRLKASGRIAELIPLLRRSRFQGKWEDTADVKPTSF